MTFFKWNIHNYIKYDKEEGSGGRLGDNNSVTFEAPSTQTPTEKPSELQSSKTAAISALQAALKKLNAKILAQKANIPAQKAEMASEAVDEMTEEQAVKAIAAVRAANDLANQEEQVRVLKEMIDKLTDLKVTEGDKVSVREMKAAVAEAEALLADSEHSAALDAVRTTILKIDDAKKELHSAQLELEKVNAKIQTASEIEQLLSDLKKAEGELEAANSQVQNASDKYLNTAIGKAAVSAKKAAQKEVDDLIAKLAVKLGSEEALSKAQEDLESAKLELAAAVESIATITAIDVSEALTKEAKAEDLEGAEAKQKAAESRVSQATAAVKAEAEKMILKNESANRKDKKNNAKQLVDDTAAKIAELGTELGTEYKPTGTSLRKTAIESTEALIKQQNKAISAARSHLASVKAAHAKEKFTSSGEVFRVSNYEKSEQELEIEAQIKFLESQRDRNQDLLISLESKHWTREKEVKGSMFGITAAMSSFRKMNALRTNPKVSETGKGMGAGKSLGAASEVFGIWKGLLSENADASIFQHSDELLKLFEQISSDRAKGLIRFNNELNGLKSTTLENLNFGRLFRQIGMLGAQGIQSAAGFAIKGLLLSGTLQALSTLSIGLKIAIRGGYIAVTRGAYLLMNGAKKLYNALKNVVVSISLYIKNIFRFPKMFLLDLGRFALASLRGGAAIIETIATIIATIPVNFFTGIAAGITQGYYRAVAGVRSLTQSEGLGAINRDGYADMPVRRILTPFAILGASTLFGIVNAIKFTGIGIYNTCLNAGQIYSGGGKKYKIGDISKRAAQHFKRSIETEFTDKEIDFKMDILGIINKEFKSLLKDVGSRKEGVSEKLVKETTELLADLIATINKYNALAANKNNNHKISDPQLLEMKNKINRLASSEIMQENGILDKVVGIKKAADGLYKLSVKDPESDLDTKITETSDDTIEQSTARMHNETVDIRAAFRASIGHILDQTKAIERASIETSTPLDTALNAVRQDPTDSLTVSTALSKGDHAASSTVVRGAAVVADQAQALAADALEPTTPTQGALA